MRNSAIPAVILFYSMVALLLAIIVIFAEHSLLGAGARALSNACENLALIAIALRVWAVRR